MSNNTWMPSDYMDESVPPGETHPTGWVRTDASGTPCMRCCYEEDRPDLNWPLVDGDKVEFTYREDHGSAILLVRPDGTWAIDVPMPENVDHAWLVDSYLDNGSYGSIEDMVAAIIEDGDRDENITMDVMYYNWPCSTWRFDLASMSFVQDSGVTQ
jgi:hypothetical protein